MICVSIYLYLLQFLSSVSYIFPCIGLLHPWLCQFPGILFFFVAIVNGIVFLVYLSVSLLLAYKNATDFWIPNLYAPNLLNPFISSSSFLVESLGCLCTVSCHLQIITFLLLPFQFWCFLFLLVWLLWLGLPVFCWVREVKVDIPVMFPMWRGTLMVFLAGNADWCSHCGKQYGDISKN